MAYQIPVASQTVSVDVNNTANAAVQRGSDNSINVGVVNTGGINNTGGLIEPSIAPTSAVTLTTANRRVNASAASAAFAVTLPLAASAPGSVFTIIKTDSSSNSVTITASGSDTINGASTKVLASQWQSADVWSNGSVWLAR